MRVIGVCIPSFFAYTVEASAAIKAPRPVVKGLILLGPLRRGGCPILEFLDIHLVLFIRDDGGLYAMLHGV